MTHQHKDEPHMLSYSNVLSQNQQENNHPETNGNLQKTILDQQNLVGDVASSYRGCVSYQESPIVGEINLFSYTPEILQPFMGLRDVDREDDPWLRPHSYHDDNHFHYSTGRQRVRRESSSAPSSFGSTKKMYLYEIDDYSMWKARKQLEQVINSLRQPFNIYPNYGNFFKFSPFRSNFGTTKLTIKTPVVNYNNNTNEGIA